MEVVARHPRGTRHMMNFSFSLKLAQTAPSSCRHGALQYPCLSQCRNFLPNSLIGHRISPLSLSLFFINQQVNNINRIPVPTPSPADL